MPRSARLDVPDVLQHMMARGIDGYDIFQDERDREAFLERLAAVVEWARADLLAWCLMSNHFHLLIRPRGELLAPIMRRLMTGYAVWHNRRHRIAEQVSTPSQELGRGLAPVSRRHGQARRCSNRFASRSQNFKTCRRAFVPLLSRNHL